MVLKLSNISYFKWKYWAKNWFKGTFYLVKYNKNYQKKNNSFVVYFKKLAWNII